jgi:hypothetical protein
MDMEPVKRKVLFTEQNNSHGQTARKRKVIVTEQNCSYEYRASEKKSFIY